MYTKDEITIFKNQIVPCNICCSGSILYSHRLPFQMIIGLRVLTEYVLS